MWKYGFKYDWLCQKKNNGNESKSQENYEGCCEGCMCGDTINLLKTTETAWMLTNVNSKGEYESTKDAFLSIFTELEKISLLFFFENDNEVKGKFTINKNDEIVLIPDDNKTSKIVCKLGEEKRFNRSYGL